MKKYFTGFIVGLILGSVTSVFAARLVGGNGYLIGWDVSIDGETVCSDPFIWASTKEIDCD